MVKARNLAGKGKLNRGSGKSGDETLTDPNEQARLAKYLRDKRQELKAKALELLEDDKNLKNLLDSASDSSRDELAESLLNNLDVDLPDSEAEVKQRLERLDAESKRINAEKRQLRKQLTKQGRGKVRL